MNTTMLRTDADWLMYSDWLEERGRVAEANQIRLDSQSDFPGKYECRIDDGVDAGVGVYGVVGGVGIDGVGGGGFDGVGY